MRRQKIVVLGAWFLTAALSLTSATQTAGYTGTWPIAWLTALAWLCAAPSLYLALGNWSAFSLLAALLFPIVALDAVLAIHFGATINAHTLTLIVGTDRAEILHALTQFWLPAVAVTVLMSLLLSATWKLRQSRSKSVVHRLAFLPHALFGAVAFFGVVWIVAQREITPNNGDVVGTQWRLAERVMPWGLPARLVSFAWERQRLAAQLKVTANFRWHARSTAPPRIVVMVIGESSRARNWQLGSYPLATTPKLKARGDVIWMQDYVANAVVTAESVPLMLTRRQVGQSNASFAEKSVVSAFREAGYATHWISAQATAGLHDLLIASYAQEAKRRSFLNLANHETAGLYDSALLPQVQAAITTDTAHLLIVVHLMGSHFRYTDRYPGKEAYFPLHGTAAEQDRRAYDNSIRHTDAVIAAIIAMLDKDPRPSGLLFASDHGELLIEPSCDKRWHGHGAVDDVRAAALVWLSPHADNQSKRQVLLQSATQKTSGQDLVASLLDAGGVAVPGQTFAHSWFGDYIERPRMVSTLSGLADADLPAVGACRLLQRAIDASRYNKPVIWLQENWQLRSCEL